MPTVEWGDSTSPIVTVQTGPGTDHSISWASPRVWHADFANNVRVRIRFKAKAWISEMRAWVELLDNNNTVTQELAHFESGLNETKSVDVPVSAQIVRFRVRAQTLDFISMGGAEHWDPEEQKIFTIFVKFVGAFSLDYVPVTILYGPPELDMTNALSQSETYGTVATLGESETVGSSSEESANVRGGISIQTPYGGLGGGVSRGEGSSSSQSAGYSINNSVAFSYTWNTTLTVDNQRAVGRAFWGPLSDLFVLLKNPWFSLSGTEKGVSLSVNAERCAEDTEILILPAYKLLRPGTDPVAARIPEETRRRLLELDPFIHNLNEFFPDDGNADLARAANPYADPTAHTVPDHGSGSGSATSYSGSNRAALLARYAISSGVELDLSATTAISVQDTNTNETVYYSEVSKSQGADSELTASFFSVVTVGESGSETSTQRKWVRIAYQASHETEVKSVKTARCMLIRNQNTEELRDIELWWDKQFSTFMFRVIDPTTLSVTGSIRDDDNLLLPNARVELQRVDKPIGSPRPIDPVPELYATMTDDRGRFAFRNVDPSGKYIVKCGATRGEVPTLSSTHGIRPEVAVQLKGVHRRFDFRYSPLWEIMDVLDTDERVALRISQQFKKVTPSDRQLIQVLEREHIDVRRFKVRGIYTPRPR